MTLLLLGLTATTGLVDAVSYLALGHVFTANMTGRDANALYAVIVLTGLAMGVRTAAYFGTAD